MVEEAHEDRLRVDDDGEFEPRGRGDGVELLRRRLGSWSGGEEAVVGADRSEDRGGDTSRFLEGEGLESGEEVGGGLTAGRVEQGFRR